jgi:hypothetical protein
MAVDHEYDGEDGPDLEPSFPMDMEQAQGDDDEA